MRTTYVIQTTQQFNVTYLVEADSPEAAWAALVSGEGAAENIDQAPADITGSFEEADIKEDE